MRCVRRKLELFARRRTSSVNTVFCLPDFSKYPDFFANLGTVESLRCRILVFLLPCLTLSLTLHLSLLIVCMGSVLQLSRVTLTSIPGRF